MNASSAVRQLGRGGRLSVAGALFSVLAIALVTGAVFALRSVAPVLSLGVLYVFAVLPVAVLWGLAYALPVSIASLLTFNFFLLPPVHTLTLRDPQNWVALAVYLVTAVVVSELAAGARRRAAEAEQQRSEAAFAADVSAALLEGGPVQEKLRRIEAQVAGVLGVARAHVELDSVRRAGAGESAHDLVAGRRHVGRLFLDAGARLDVEVTRRVLPALASLLASAADRERLARKAVEAEALRRSDASKTTILRTLSHDLRTPLTAISAASEVLEEGGASLSAPERAELAASVRLEARRLNRLVSNLLDLSRLEAGAASPRPELWTVDGLVARALEAIGPEAARVDVSLPDDSPTLRVDPAQIERTLANVLENALRFSSPADRVEIRTRVSGGELAFRVVDRGPGLSPEDLERVFEPFERGAGVAGEGTGLGLAIARGFAQANGGRLWAESVPGEGASFILALPLAAAAAKVGA